MRNWALCGALLVSAGCAVRGPATYRLVRQPAGEVLIPPGMPAPGAAEIALAIRGTVACAPAGEVIKSVRRGRRLRLTVGRDALLQQPPGWLGNWASGAEAQGCIAPGEGAGLADRIAQSLPLPPSAAFRLLYGNDRRTGQVEIGPRTRLEVTSPIFRDGAAPDAAGFETVETAGGGNSLTITVRSTGDLVGYEVAWYGLEPRPGGGYRIVPLSAERHVEGASESRPRPAFNYFQFPSEAAYYRLFYKAGQTEYTALAVAGCTRTDLEVRTRQLDTGTATCERLPDALCVSIPKRVAVNPRVAVTVNGAVFMAGWGATVGEVIRESGERQPNAVLPRLTVAKPYPGGVAPVEFDHNSPAILGLVLLGGEVIGWK